MLRLTLHYGKVGAIDYADGSRHHPPVEFTANLFRHDPALKRPRAGDGQSQRLPGATAHMKLLPGAARGGKRYPDCPQPGEKMAAWRLSLTTPAAKPAAAIRPAAPLYLYDLTTLNDILYLSGGGDIEFNQHNDGNHNGSLYYSIPFGYWTLQRLRRIQPVSPAV